MSAKHIAIGYEAPDFELASNRETTIKLSSERGTNIVLVLLRGFS